MFSGTPTQNFPVETVPSKNNIANLNNFITINFFTNIISKGKPIEQMCNISKHNYHDGDEHYKCLHVISCQHDIYVTLIVDSVLCPVRLPIQPPSVTAWITTSILVSVIYT